MRTGAIDALATQSGFETGYQALVHAVRMLNGEQVPDEILISGQLVTQENCGREEESDVSGAFGG